MGIYNCALTLPEALDSLLAQTYKNFKVILCDDGSKDNTYEVAKEYASKHDNIVLIQNDKNRGLNYTLNHCLEYVDTEYIARMDGDDLCDPTRFEKEIKFLDAHSKYAIVSCHMFHFDDNGIFRTSGNAEGEPKLSDFPKGTPFRHAPCMVRTTAMNDVGGYSVDDKLLRVEDYHLWIKMYVKGYKGYNLKEPLYMMRDDENAIARRKWKGNVNEFYVKNLAVSMLGLPFYMHIYSLRPIITHCLPKWLYKILHKKFAK